MANSGGTGSCEGFRRTKSPLDFSKLRRDYFDSLDGWKDIQGGDYVLFYRCGIRERCKGRNGFASLMYFAYSHSTNDERVPDDVLGEHNYAMGALAATGKIRFEGFENGKKARTFVVH